MTNGPADDMQGRHLVERMCERRSTPPRHLSAPGPGEEEIALLVRAASRAPDHAGLHPFRFERVGDGQRARLAECFVAAEREIDPDATQETLERASEQARHAPVLLALISTIRPHAAVPEIEQRASAGAALGYVLLAADLLGYGAMAVSGRRLATRALRDAFRLTQEDALLCFVGIGTRMKTRGPAPEPDPALLRSWS